MLNQAEVLLAPLGRNQSLVLWVWIFTMKVRIDYDLCMGDRNCNKVCPEVQMTNDTHQNHYSLVSEPVCPPK